MKGKLLLILMLFLSTTALFAQENINISGRIVEAESKDGVPMASIIIKGTTIETVADHDGNYSLSAPKGATLIFSSMGKTSVEVPVNNRTVINVELKEDLAFLDEVVVVGYGTTVVKDLTAPITTIKSSELTKQTVSNPVQGLQGKVPGVMISSSGAPGTSPQIRIRGLGTVSSEASPLYVVDNMFVNDISFLSNNDIESITILKDASSSAIYGVRAANGVVLITTKKGAKIEQRPVIEYNGYVGVQTLRKFKLTDAEGYKTLTNEKLAVQNIDPIDFSKFNANTDWMDEILRSAVMHSHEASVSGNTGKSNYFAGISYLSQEGVIVNSDYERINLRVAHDIDISKYIKIGYNMNISYFDQLNPKNSALGSAFKNPPVVPVRDADGNFSGFSGLVSSSNSVAEFEYNKFNKTRGVNYLPNVYLEIKPIKDLSFRTSFTLDGGNAETKVYVPVYKVSENQKNDRSELKKHDSKRLNYTFDNTLTYSRNFEKHRFSAMAGLSMIHFKDNWMEAAVRDVPFIDESSLYIKNGDQSTLKVIDDGSKIRSLSYFGRLFYAFDNKYLLTATLRRDGSSTFPKSNRWATAPSIGLGWVMSEEGFLKGNKTINYMKLRASWGLLGNNNIPQNAYRQVINVDGGLSYAPDGTIVQGAAITSRLEDRLKWETVSEYDLGLEMALFNHRLTFEADYYHRTTKDAIFPYSTYGVFGSFDREVVRNNANILNTGVEFSVGWADKVNDNFGYNLGFNISYNKNEVTKLVPGTVPFFSGQGVNGSQAIYTRTGDPVAAFHVYDAIGIFQNAQDVQNHVSNGKLLQPEALPGDFKYADTNGDGILDDDDRITVGSYTPKVVFGFNVGFNYKQFDFSMDLQGVLGNKIYNFKRVERFGNENYDNDFYKNRWHGEGTSNKYPSADISGRKNALPNTFYIESGSYLRIRNLQLGYTVPSNKLAKIGISNLRIFVTAQNPFTFSKYKGMSPEITKNLDPLARGADGKAEKIKAVEQGIDTQIYPMSSVYSFGVNFKF